MRSRASLLPLPRAVILRFGANPPNSPPPPNQNVTVPRQSDDNSRPPIVRAAIIALIILLLLACGALALGYTTGRIGGNSTASNPTPTATPAIQTTPSTAPTATSAPAINGLTGAYYRMTTYPAGQAVPAMPTGTPVFTSVDANIDMPLGVWGVSGTQHYPHPELGDLGPNGFAIRWTGHITPPTTGTYTFVTRSDDGVRVWVNEQLIVENWTIHSDTQDCSDRAAPGTIKPGPQPATCPTIQLTGGQAYSIKVEYYENQLDGATIRLFWITPGSTARQIVPSSVLAPQ